MSLAEGIDHEFLESVWPPHDPDLTPELLQVAEIVAWDSSFNKYDREHGIGFFDKDMERGNRTIINRARAQIVSSEATPEPPDIGRFTLRLMSPQS